MIAGYTPVLIPAFLMRSRRKRERNQIEPQSQSTDASSRQTGINQITRRRLVLIGRPKGNVLEGVKFAHQPGGFDWR